MAYPPRLSHLVTRPILVARLSPTYAAAHQIDDDEADTRLDAALSAGGSAAGSLRDRLLDATWSALLGTTKRLDDAGLLEKVAKALQDRPFRRGRPAQVDAGWSAFLILVDLEVGTAGDAARRVMESEEGLRRAQAGLRTVGEFLAKELTRK